MPSDGNRALAASLVIACSVVLPSCSSFISPASEPPVDAGFKCVRWEKVYNPTFDETTMECQSYEKATP